MERRAADLPADCPIESGHWQTETVLMRWGLVVLESDDVRSNFGRRRQSQKFPLPAYRVERVHLCTVPSWHSVPPREEVIPAAPPSRPESLSAAREHVAGDKAESLYPFG